MFADGQGTRRLAVPVAAVGVLLAAAFLMTTSAPAAPKETSRGPTGPTGATGATGATGPTGPEGRKTPSPPGMIRETETCEIPSTKEAFATAIYEGEYKPEIGVAKKGNLSGSSAGKPSSTRFEGSSTGVLHSQVTGEATALGNLKYLGYNEQEIIAVTGTALTLKLTPEGIVDAGGEWVFSGPERKTLTIENPSINTPAELLTQQIKVISGGANFTPVFLGAPEPPNCSSFNNPPVVTLPAGGKCNVGVESAGHAGTFATYVLTYKEPKETAKTVELKVND